LEHVLETVWKSSVELSSQSDIVPTSVGGKGTEIDDVFGDSCSVLHLHGQDFVLGSILKVRVSEHAIEFIAKESPVINDGGRWLLREEWHPPGAGKVPKVGSGEQNSFPVCRVSARLGEEPMDTLRNEGGEFRRVSSCEYVGFFQFWTRFRCSHWVINVMGMPRPRGRDWERCK
jgi:hypothetical protein